MRHIIDHSRRLVLMAARPGFSGAVLSKATARMLDAMPVTASYDFVLDMRRSDTGASQADLDIVLESYHRQAREPGLKFGCYVTSDPNFELWARAMDPLFGDRRNLVFPTLEAALAFLETERGRDFRSADEAGDGDLRAGSGG